MEIIHREAGVIKSRKRTYKKANRKHSEDLKTLVEEVEPIFPKFLGY